MCCRNLLGMPERCSSFPDGLETESGMPCIDPWGGGSFGRMAEQSPLTRPSREGLCQSQHWTRSRRFLQRIPMGLSIELSEEICASSEKILLFLEKRDQRKPSRIVAHDHQMDGVVKVSNCVRVEK